MHGATGDRRTGREVKPGTVGPQGRAEARAKDGISGGLDVRDEWNCGTQLEVGVASSFWDT